MKRLRLYRLDIDRLRPEPFLRWMQRVGIIMPTVQTWRRLSGRR